MGAGFGERQPHEPDHRLNPQIAQPGHAGNGVFEQRQPVAFQQQRAQPLGGGREPQPALGGVIERRRRQPDALALLAVEQQRLGETLGVGRQQQKERVARVLPRQVLLYQPRQRRQGLLDRKVAINDDLLGLFPDRGRRGARPARRDTAGGRPGIPGNKSRAPGKPGVSASTRFVVSRAHSAPAMTVASRQPRSPAGMRASFWFHRSRPEWTRYPSLGTRCRPQCALNSSTLVGVWK